MDHSADTNAAIWRSGENVQAWAAEGAERERRRAATRQFMARLLPFEGQPFTSPRRS